MKSNLKVDKTSHVLYFLPNISLSFDFPSLPVTLRSSVWRGCILCFNPLHMKSCLATSLLKAVLLNKLTDIALLDKTTQSSNRYGSSSIHAAYDIMSRKSKGKPVQHSPDSAGKGYGRIMV